MRLKKTKLINFGASRWMVAPLRAGSCLKVNVVLFDKILLNLVSLLILDRPPHVFVIGWVSFVAL